MSSTLPGENVLKKELTLPLLNPIFNASVESVLKPINDLDIMRYNAASPLLTS